MSSRYNRSGSPVEESDEDERVQRRRKTRDEGPRRSARVEGLCRSDMNERHSPPVSQKPLVRSKQTKDRRRPNNQKWFVRCRCGDKHDDSYDCQRCTRPMIACDQCLVWLHLECLGFSTTASKVTNWPKNKGPYHSPSDRATWQKYLPSGYVCKKCRKVGRRYISKALN